MQPPAVHSAYPKDGDARSEKTVGVIRPEQAIRRTVWGVSLVGLGLGLATAGSLLGLFSLSIASSGIFFAVIGFAFLLAYPGALGASHRRGVLAGVIVGGLALATLIVLPEALALSSGGLGYTGYAAMQRARVLGSSLFVLMALAAVFLASYGLQDRAGRALLVAGLSAAVVLQGLLWLWLNAALDAALARALTLGDFEPLIDFPLTWMRIGALNAVPCGLFLVAFERLYWQLRRRYFPHASFLDV